MAEQIKRKEKKTVSKRVFLEEETCNTSSMSNKTLINLFETFMRAKKLEGLRERTLKEHRATFKHFVNFLNNRFPNLKNADEITIDIIRDYVYYMSKEKRLWDDHTMASCQFKTDKKGLSPYTVNIRLRTLKCFLKFLFEEVHIPNNPASKVKLLKTEKDTIQAFQKNKLLIFLINLIKELMQVSWTMC